MSRFFYAVIVPVGASEEIFSGRIQQENASEAIQRLEEMHPRATEIHVRKEKTRAVSRI